MSIFNKKKKTPKPDHKSGSSLHSSEDVDNRFRVVFNSRGLLPVVIQNSHSNEVLRLGYMDRRAFHRTLSDREVYLYRRSKDQIERFGERNNFQYRIESVHLDRSYRSLLIKISPGADSAKKTAYVHPINFSDLPSEDVPDETD